MPCHHVDQVFVCSSFGVMSCQFSNTCMCSLYRQQFKSTQKLSNSSWCQLRSKSANSGRAILVAYLPIAKTVCIKCQNRLHSELHLRKGTQQVYVSPGCQGFLSKQLITLDCSIRLNNFFADLYCCSLERLLIIAIV
jgi:hypothetical protein